MNENYYDVTEISNMFGLSETTIRNYFKSGKIIAKKIGKSWHARETDIKDYLNSDKSDSHVNK